MIFWPLFVLIALVGIGVAALLAHDLPLMDPESDASIRRKAALRALRIRMPSRFDTPAETSLAEEAIAERREEVRREPDAKWRAALNGWLDYAEQKTRDARVEQRVAARVAAELSGRAPVSPPKRIDLA
jgi:hypothetical protein